MKSKRKPGTPEFIPTDEQRRFVAAMCGVKLTWDEIALQVINPRTGKGISKATLSVHFPSELAAGKARMKAIIGTRFIEKVNGGDNWALQFALRHINGWKDNDMSVSVGDNGERQVSSIQVSFVKANHVDDDE